MDHGVDLWDELAAGVRDAAGAWRFIRRFAEGYTRPIVAGDGCDEDELQRAEAGLGFELPASLRQAYALIGRRDDLTPVQDRLVAPDQLRVDRCGQVLVFRVENQNVAQWGIPLGAVSQPDPPVVFRLDSFRPAEREWQPFVGRVSVAVVEMVLSEWMLSGGEPFADNRELDDTAVMLVEDRFRRLPMPDYPLWDEPLGPPTRWFSGLGAIVRVDAEAWLWVRAASPQEIAAVRQALPGNWHLADA